MFRSIISASALSYFFIQLIKQRATSAKKRKSQHYRKQTEYKKILSFQ